MVLDVRDRILDRADLLRVLVRDVDLEGLLESEDKLDQTERNSSIGRLANSAIFLRMSLESGDSERHTTMSGWMPIRRSSLTECCVGLVLSSPAWLM